MEADQNRPIRSDREDGRYLHTDLFLRDYYRRTQPKLAYNPSFTLAEYRQWKPKVIEKLWELLKIPENVPAQPSPKMLWAAPRDGYTLQKWEFYPEPYSVVPFLMLVPDGACAARPAPAVMCYPGTSLTKEGMAGEPDIYRAMPDRYANHNEMALHHVKQGFVAVAVEHPGFGELKPTDAETSADRFSLQMLIMGRSYQGLSTFQKMGILRWVERLDFVDAANIYASGHSLGKIPSLFLGLLCDSVKGIVYNNDIYDQRIRLYAGPTTYLWTNCFTHLIPNMEEWFTFPDLLAAYAPKYLLITEGGVTSDLRKIQAAYALQGRPDAFSYQYFPRYDTPEKRLYDNAPVPEGLDYDEYYAYCNVDRDNHYYKEALATAWLDKLRRV